MLKREMNAHPGGRQSGEGRCPGTRCPAHSRRIVRHPRVRRVCPTTAPGGPSEVELPLAGFILHSRAGAGRLATHRLLGMQVVGIFHGLCFC